MPKIRSLFLASALVVASLCQTVPAGATSATTPVNDWGCRPTSEHPRPVVLLHGLSTNAGQNWALHGPAIAKAGYCVFSLTYGVNQLGMGGQGSVAASAPEIGEFIDRVRATTDAETVDLVGHSLGGFLALFVTKVNGYAPKVGRVVAMAPPTHGTTLLGLLRLTSALGIRGVVGDALAATCPACVDLVEGGPAQVELTAGPVAQPGVTYTVIASRFEAIVTPSSRSFIREPGVRNYYVQDRCPLDPVGHFGLGMDFGVTSMILNGLDPSTPIRCGFGPPL